MRRLVLERIGDFAHCASTSLNEHGWLAKWITSSMMVGFAVMIMPAGDTLSRGG